MTSRHTAPAHAVTVLTNSHCPHCVLALEYLTDWAEEAHVPIAGVDIWSHPEAASWTGAAGSPIVVFEHALATGAFRMEDPEGEDVVFVGIPSHEDFQRLVRGE